MDMDDEDIRHWQHLIQEHKRYRRVLEGQAASHGKLTPPHVVTGIEDATRQINELEQRIRRRIRNAGENGVFYSAEQVDEIRERHEAIAKLERKIIIVRLKMAEYEVDLSDVAKLDSFKGHFTRASKIIPTVLWSIGMFSIYLSSHTIEQASIGVVIISTICGFVLFSQLSEERKTKKRFGKLLSDLRQYQEDLEMHRDALEKSTRHPSN